MKVEINWQRPVVMKKDRKTGVGYSDDILEKIPKLAGVYVFYRQWGNKKEALYVGRSTNLKRRIKAHLNSIKLMRHVRAAKNGKLMVRVGICNTRAGARRDKMLAIAEKALIRHFIAEGHDLSNQQGTVIRVDEISFTGGGVRNFIPRKMNVQKSG